MWKLPLFTTVNMHGTQNIKIETITFLKCALNFPCGNESAVRLRWRKNTAGRWHRAWAISLWSSDVSDWISGVRPCVFIYSWPYYWITNWRQNFQNVIITQVRDCLYSWVSLISWPASSSEVSGSNLERGGWLFCSVAFRKTSVETVPLNTTPTYLKFCFTQIVLQFCTTYGRQIISLRINRDSARFWICWIYMIRL
jgi:hypothetical protein